FTHGHASNTHSTLSLHDALPIYINFSKFKTYKWVILKDAPTANDLVTKQLRDAVDKELATKGLTKIDDDTASLFIGYQAGIGQEDRKSTRLNSSHDQISYAVFCS